MGPNRPSLCHKGVVVAVLALLSIFSLYFNFLRSPRSWSDIQNLDQQDPRLIKYVKEHYLHPFSYYRSYNLSRPRRFPTPGSDGYNAWVSNFFGGKKKGVFIEVGANDGEQESHTLYLEMELGWRGLLIECNPYMIPRLLSRNRKAWVAGACLAQGTTPRKRNFSYPVGAELSATMRRHAYTTHPILDPIKRWVTFEVETYPLYTILAAVGLKEVDYVSLDIEGMELAVLENFPFHLVTFKVLIVEVSFYDDEERAKLNGLLERNGYVYLRDVTILSYLNNKLDNVYVHESMKHFL